LQEVYALYGQAKEKISDMPATAAAAVYEAAKLCNVGRTLKEVSRLASTDKSIHKRLCTAHRQLDIALKTRQRQEAERQGIDIKDLAKWSEMRSSILGPDDRQEVDKQHAARTVPRFGSDLSFHSRGIQVCAQCARSVHLPAHHVRR
jgi:transcription initiation factor TFIIIB Brf1 subunit/transcription initiation factor TFIIB